MSKRILIGRWMWCGAVLLLAMGLALAQAPVARPFAAEALRDTPWGQTVDGLACRVVADADYCPGEPISLLVQIKNVSQATRYFTQIFDSRGVQLSWLTVVTPDGTAVTPPDFAAQFIPSADYSRPIAPGQVINIEIPDVRAMGMGNFAAPGVYTVRYEFNETSGPIVNDASDPAVKTGWWTGHLVSNAAAVKVVPLTADDLRIHEWGVLDVEPGAMFANAALKSEWATLPAFVYHSTVPDTLPPPVAIDRKPVVYAYTKRPSLQVRVSVDFGTGTPAAWWPNAVQKTDMSKGVIARQIASTLTWQGWLGERYPLQLTTAVKPVWMPVSLADVPATSWLRNARLPGAAAFTVPNLADKPGYESERFLYYDGLVPVTPAVRYVRATGDTIVIENLADYAVKGVLLVDHRTGAGRYAFLDTLPARSTKTLTLQPIRTDAWPHAARTPLGKALTAAGLTEAEANSMLDIWSAGLFDANGLTACYLLPQSEYARLLPMQVDPMPQELVRVSLVRVSSFDRGPQGTP